MDSYALMAVLTLALGLALLVAEVFIPSGGIIMTAAGIVFVISVWSAWQAWGKTGELTLFLIYIAALVVLFGWVLNPPTTWTILTEGELPRHQRGRAQHERQRRRRHVGLHPDRHRHAAAGDGAELLSHHQRVGIVEARAAELDRLVQPEEAEAAHLLEQLMRRKDVGLLPCIDMRVDLVGDELLQGAADVVVVGGE